jgi:transketolase
MQDQEIINLLKGLVIDGVNKANSGHPGGAMSSMDFTYQLFTKHLGFDPTDAKWAGRDRFILSAGHESMLLYAQLFAIGWLEESDLQNFRQLHSRTPGHPENFMTPGVECTTGPLGQGAAMSVGFAIGGAHLAATLDRDLYSYKIWSLLGDGCMQEDVTLGAASLAGHLGLANLIWYYDKNRQQISGDISRATSDDEKLIFKGFGWNVLEVNGHDLGALDKAMIQAKQSSDRPTLIIGNSTMAKGAATQEGQHSTHGAPLSKDERSATKAKLGVPTGKDFYFPEAARSSYQANFSDRKAAGKLWKVKLAEKLATNKEFAKAYNGYFGSHPGKDLPKVDWNVEKSLATRNAFGEIIAKWAHALPGLIGGSADLEPSNMTGAFAKSVGDFSRENRQGRNLAFGVREFPMSAISNGLALHGGFVPFDATFLSFADYSRPALRLGAIQKVRTIHEFTHDSFYLGEDGPTHQPIEHVMSLRLIPDMYVMRPGDCAETEVLMRVAVDLKLPSCICLTRQGLPFFNVSRDEIQKASKGAWIVRKAESPTIIIFATGSEVSLALKSADLLTNESVQVVSVPCWELLDEQSHEYQKDIYRWDITKRVSIEAGVTTGWQKFVGHAGVMIGINHFGASAPAEVLEKEYGFTPDAVSKKIKAHKFH